MDTLWYCLLLYGIFLTLHEVIADEYDLEEPTQCEVCKYFVTEFKSRLDETGKSKEVLRTGHGLDSRKKKDISYATSELRLIEVMDGICEKIMEYNIHKERKGSLRFAKGMSETFKTLHGLREKGVKVELGIPEDMWDEPSVEISLMKKQCEMMLERHEESIESWYFNHQKDKPLQDFLCKDIVLGKNNQECLREVWTGKETKYDQVVDEETAKRKKSKKKKKASKKNQKGESGDSSSDTSESDSKTESKEEL
ncbi:protein canopy 4-like [Styela clava]